MIDQTFVHLRVPTAYSLSEGALKLPKLVDLCKAHGTPAVAVTDSNNLFGALEFSIAASKAGIQPIIGIQIDVARDGEAGKHSNANPEASPHDRLVLLVQNEIGYQNLMVLYVIHLLKLQKIVR